MRKSVKGVKRIIYFLTQIYNMPFISSYNGAMKILSEIGTGTCKGRCKSTWVRNLKYALKTKTNPLRLDKRQRKTLTEKIEKRFWKKIKLPSCPNFNYRLRNSSFFQI